MTRGKKRKKSADKENPKRDAFELYHNGRWMIKRLAARFGKMSARKGYVKFTRKQANDLWQIDSATEKA